MYAVCTTRTATWSWRRVVDAPSEYVSEQSRESKVATKLIMAVFESWQRRCIPPHDRGSYASKALRLRSGMALNCACVLGHARGIPMRFRTEHVALKEHLLELS